MSRTLLLLGLLAPAVVAAQTDARALERQMQRTLTRGEAELIALRHDIHQHPELSGEESRTAALVADRLRALGFTVRTDVGGHGVVGLLRGGKPGPVVAFRADMDAVPSSDVDPASYRSLTPGVRHICGHDIHTVLGLALAGAFASIQPELPGSLLLIFQPAEELATGARAMLGDNVFSLARPVAIYAVHTAPLQVGMVGSEPGPLLAGRDNVEITMRGAASAVAADSMLALLQSLGTITPRDARGSVPPDFVMAEVRPPQRFGADSTTVRATFTIADPYARTRTRESVEAGVRTLQKSGFRADLSYRDQEIAGVTNDATLTQRGEKQIRAALGDSALTRVGVVSPLFSEDFGSFQNQVPGVMYLLGVSNATRGWVGMPHSPGYMADDAAIVIGARALAGVLLDRMTTVY